MAFEKQKGQTRLPAPERSDGGQVLLIVILVVIIALTVGLSLASRSITSLRSSTEEAESQKALAAAEAGIERAIQGNVITTGVNILNDNLSNKSQYAVDVVQGDSSKFLINGGNAISKDEGADVWFLNHNSDGSLNYSDYFSTSPNFLNLYWGSSSDGCSDAAIQAVIITRDPSLPDTSPNKIKSYRYVYDACSARRSENKFTSAVANFIDGTTDFRYSTPVNDLAKNINGNKNIILMRVIPIYNDAVIGVYTCNNGGNNCTGLPSQGYKITSTGTSGQASRKLTVFKGYPQAYLPYLSYGLFVAN